MLIKKYWEILMKIKIAKTEVIHFIGIGGIGMSGLSLIMKGKGFKIQGSDLNYNKNIERLKKERIKIFIGQKKQNLKNATIVVISSAIKKNNPEMIEAKRKNLPIITRGKMLAHIVSLMKNIVVVGSHGKTTTTSLIASIFEKTKGDIKMTEEPEGIEFVDFETFMKVDLRVGKITSVEDHPNADKLYVVKLDDGTDNGRTICAGLKNYYTIDEMTGKTVVFVSNLKPRPLRGITSEGMMLAADDGEGNVKLITVDGDIGTGSQVR